MSRSNREALHAEADHKVEEYVAQEVDVRKMNKRIVATPGKTLLPMSLLAAAHALPVPRLATLAIAVHQLPTICFSLALPQLHM